MEGPHYYRGFTQAIIRGTSSVQDIEVFCYERHANIADLRIKPSSVTLAAVIQQLESGILLHTTEIKLKMIVECMRDVSIMFYLVSSVSDTLLQSELNSEVFVFGHSNYARYLTYRHVRLLDIQTANRMVWDDFVKKGFGGSLTGELGISPHCHKLTRHSHS